MNTEFNTGLIGKKGSRFTLQTPALVIDLEALEANIRTMADFAAANDVKLRPHTKTHKSVEIALRQMGEGAIGICVATLGEAEVMVNGGLSSILLTTPVEAR